ncbi:nuclear cap-binding protein [Cystoisospora suis]|uniref:Nuclear cap-binding protein n=1 Tax=Cystoisospora suis TaxID=483139 RepID=A0A2C6LAC5_9APIC|nr:nuclear cap-binding protein [Cystoisospora suis]
MCFSLSFFFSFRILEDHLLTILHSFKGNINLCAEALLRIPVDHPQFDYILIECLFSAMLRLPTKVLPEDLEESSFFLTRVLHRISQMQNSLVSIIETSLTSLLNHASQFDFQTMRVVADFFGYWLAVWDGRTRLLEEWLGLSIPPACMKVFVKESLENACRIRDRRELKSLLPECVYAYIPPEAIPVCPYTSAELEEQEILRSLKHSHSSSGISSLAYPPGYWEFQELQKLLLFSFKTPMLSKTSPGEGPSTSLSSRDRSNQKNGASSSSNGDSGSHGDSSSGRLHEEEASDERDRGEERNRSSSSMMTTGEGLQDEREEQERKEEEEGDSSASTSSPSFQTSSGNQENNFPFSGETLSKKEKKSKRKNGEESEEEKRERMRLQLARFLLQRLGRRTWKKKKSTSLSRREKAQSYQNITLSSGGGRGRGGEEEESSTNGVSDPSVALSSSPHLISGGGGGEEGMNSHTASAALERSSPNGEAENLKALEAGKNEDEDVKKQEKLSEKRSGKEEEDDLCVYTDAYEEDGEGHIWNCSALTQLLVYSLLHRGLKTLTHSERLVENYSSVFSFLKQGAGRIAYRALKASERQLRKRDERERRKKTKEGHLQAERSKRDDDMHRGDEEKKTGGGEEEEEEVMMNEEEEEEEKRRRRRKAREDETLDNSSSSSEDEDDDELSEGGGGREEEEDDEEEEEQDVMGEDEEDEDDGLTREERRILQVENAILTAIFGFWKNSQQKTVMTLRHFERFGVVSKEAIIRFIFESLSGVDRDDSRIMEVFDLLFQLCINDFRLKGGDDSLMHVKDILHMALTGFMREFLQEEQPSRRLSLHSRLLYIARDYAQYINVHRLTDQIGDSVTEEFHQLLVISSQVQSEYYHMNREGEGLLDSLYTNANEDDILDNRPSSASARGGGLNDIEDEEDHDMMAVGGGGEGS